VIEKQFIVYKIWLINFWNALLSGRAPSSARPNLVCWFFDQHSRLASAALRVGLSAVALFCQKQTPPLAPKELSSILVFDNRSFNNASIPHAKIIRQMVLLQNDFS